MNAALFNRLKSVGMLLSLVTSFTIGQALAEEPARPYDPCKPLSGVIWDEKPEIAFPIQCLGDEIDPIGQGDPPLRQLIRTATLLFTTPPNAALPGRLWFSLSGERDVNQELLRRRGRSVLPAGSVPALRQR